MGELFDLLKINSVYRIPSLILKYEGTSYVSRSSFVSQVRLAEVLCCNDEDYTSMCRCGKLRRRSRSTTLGGKPPSVALTPRGVEESPLPWHRPPGRCATTSSRYSSGTLSCCSSGISSPNGDPLGGQPSRVEAAFAKHPLGRRAPTSRSGFEPPHAEGASSPYRQSQRQESLGSTGLATSAEAASSRHQPHRRHERVANDGR